MFTRPVDFEEYKEAMLQVYSTIKDHQLENWVMDSTKTIITLQEQKWSTEHLGLLLQETPLVKVAMVRANDAILQISAESIRNKVYRIFGKQKELEHFSNLPDALAFMLPGQVEVEEAMQRLNEVIKV